VVSPSVSEQLRIEAIQAPLEDWSIIDVFGSHRERFLHSQLSSDVSGLDDGRSQISALLDRSGRLQAYFYLLKRNDRIELLVPADAAAALREQLKAHIIADDVTIGSRSPGSMRICLGPEALRAHDRLPVEEVFPIEAFGARGYVTWSPVSLEYPELKADELEMLRVVSGTPKWGVDACAGMLINETRLVATAVSFTKGCFLGQETVAKVASHRGAAFQTALLVVDGDPPGAADWVGREFAVGERAKGGVIRSRVPWLGDTVYEVALYRDLRVEGLEILFCIDEVSLMGRVALSPLVATPSVEEQATDLFHVAAEAFGDDREDEALALLERAIAVDPGHADSYESLGVILGRHGRYPEAIEFMKRLLEVDPDSVMAHSNMSVYYNQLGRIEEAEREAGLAAEKSLLGQRREQQRADDERQSRQQRQAELKRREAMYLEVLELDPDDTLGNFGMGEVCVENGRFEDAVQHLERVVEQDPNYSAAYLALGRAWEGMRQPDRAREVFAAGVEVAASRGDLATANKMQGRLTELGR
jgi:folate-binding protein YgfZ